METCSRLRFELDLAHILVRGRQTDQVYEVPVSQTGSLGRGDEWTPRTENSQTQHSGTAQLAAMDASHRKLTNTAQQHSTASSSGREGHH